MKQKKQIIDLENKRYGLFMSQNSFDLEVMYGRNFLLTDNVQEVIIHRVNIIETKTHSLYGQTKAKNRRYLTPVIISAFVMVEEGKQSYLGNNPGGITRDDTGNISIGVYLKELEEKNIEINRGDIIEYNMSGSKNRYYEVDNANNVTDTTDKTIGGFGVFYKKITGVPVKTEVISYLDETKGENIV